MRFNIRALFDSLSFPGSVGTQPTARDALPLGARSDRIPPQVEFPTKGEHPKAKDTDTAPSKHADKDPALTTTIPLPLPPSTVPGPAPATVTITSISTHTITSTITSSYNVTWHDLATEIQTVTSHVPTTLHTTVTANSTLTATATSTLVAPTHTVSAKLVPEKKVSTAGVLAVVSGVMNLALLVVMFFLVRRFYKMYRGERVLRKQTQTEGIELRGSKGAGGVGGGGEKKDEWEL